MGLEDFEKQLAESKLSKDQGEDGERRHHRHHHRSSRHKHEHRTRDDKHRNRSHDDKRRHGRGEEKKVVEAEEDEWVEKEVDGGGEKMQRDAWMQEPSAVEIDIVRSRKPQAPPGQFVTAKESGNYGRDADHVTTQLGEDSGEEAEKENGEEAISYTFGDAGSSWRLTKLKAVYRQAEESGRNVDDVAKERYGDLRQFDDAREEEREMDRRKMYGEDYAVLLKPSGELFREREVRQDDAIPEVLPPTPPAPLDQNALNKLKAEMLKARLRNAPNAAELEEEYTLAAATSTSHVNSAEANTVVLSRMENRQLAGGRAGEVTAVTGKRGRERGLVEENEDMSIEDMVRQEKRAKGARGGEGRAFADRIAKDGKFKDDLDYMDENATSLGKNAVKSDVHLRNTAISDYQAMQKSLASCPLCHHEDTGQAPTAPVVSLATRTYLTLPTEPEIGRGGAVIVPIEHRVNLLECDDDEWEEMRNFMKALTRHYHAQDRGVLFYENAASIHRRRGHAALHAVPLPLHLAESASAYFKEAILASDEQWTQHQPIIDTLALSRTSGYGKQAFRRRMVKEMPYFHVFFTLDGGLGHVIEDERRWPKGDLFAREVLGGMLDLAPDVIKRQGRWERGDKRVEPFRKKWTPFDWTRVLMDVEA